MHGLSAEMYSVDNGSTMAETSRPTSVEIPLQGSDAEVIELQVSSSSTHKSIPDLASLKGVVRKHSVTKRVKITYQPDSHFHNFALFTVR